MILWVWESAAPLAAGSGVSDDKDRGLAAAAKWMRDHKAEHATAEEVMFVSDALTPVYVPAPRAPLEATRDARGRIRWRPGSVAAATGRPGGWCTDHDRWCRAAIFPFTRPPCKTWPIATRG